jgi:asparagine synthase (glutamine-hydrolysing)
MCGIVGKLYFGRSGSVDEGLIEKMCSQIIHRGPDDKGIYVNNSIGLGMRRLSIIDLEGGSQPLFNEDKSIVIVYNGETYNFLDLRESLKRRGHRFYTQTDTEVLVHAYEEYGLEFVNKLRGMFAFAIWDEHNKRLVIARDRMGQKPLYYKEENGTLWFCSEIRSMLADPLVERRVDLRSLDFYLTFNYVPSPLTIFHGIKKLPPGGILICEHGQIRLQEYWTIDNRERDLMDEQEYAQRLYDLLSESVKMRLISDVPLGAFLSGGIDSSIIVSLMAEHSSGPVKTFSIGFTESDFSELEFARLVAERFSTNHHEYIVSSDVQDLIPKLIWHYSEPVGDSSAIPTYYVSKMTRQSVTVALSGDGGDELFAGYGKYPLIQNIISKNYLDGFFRAIMTRFFLSRDLNLPVNSWPKRIQESIGYRFSSPKHRDFMWITHFDSSFKKRLYTSRVLNNIQKQQAWSYYNLKTNQSPNKDVLSQISFMDLACYLPDDLLIKVDIASMANSLEVRSPFLDHEFVEFAVSIPNYYKLYNGVTKYLLKKTFGSLIPKEILEREKMGFSIPIDKWFRTELHQFSREILLTQNEAINEYFDQDFLRHMIDAHIAGTANHGAKLWLLINFVIWYNMFIYDFKQLRE